VNGDDLTAVADHDHDHVNVWRRLQLPPPV